MAAAADRRQTILAMLQNAPSPVSAGTLAGKLGVSRQVIVGDIALLRAAGEEISATPRGYVMARPAPGAWVVRTVACVHTSAQMGDELRAMVDAGAEVVDVIVEHPVYGQLTGPLRLTCRRDVEEFLHRAEGAEPLSSLTGGIHLHTLRAPSRAVLDRTLSALREQGFLLEE